MPKNLRALPKILPQRGLFLPLLVFALSGAGLRAQDGTAWYRSNSSGMTLERVPSRAAAMRNEYCLSVRIAGEGESPELLRPYYDPSFLIELRILYENGKESRRQWIFRNGEGTARLNASGGGGFFGGEGEGEKRGFIEVYNEGGFISEERQFNSDSSESFIRFFYNRDTLVRAETRIKEAPAEEAVAEDPQSGGGEGGDASPEDGAERPADEPAEKPAQEKDEDGYILMTTDFYRYTRSRSLRAIERVYHAAGNEPVRIPLPSINPGFSRDVVFVNPGIAYSSEFLQDVIVPEGGRVIYTTDSRGRVLVEQRLDDAENVIAEIRNTWSENRLASVLYKAGEDERLTEYEYDEDGSRILERNYTKGMLERVVRSDKERDVEELYMNGELILRALWEEGRKISEERVRPSRTGGNPQ
jgi:hypothetical protein